jgi:hypothetical protein
MVDVSIGGLKTLKSLFNHKKSHFYIVEVEYKLFFIYDFQFLPQSKHVTNMVAGSSALLVCNS